MSQFTKDFKEILEDPFMGSIILQERQEEINRLKTHRDDCKNGFRRQVIIQELEKRMHEYRLLDELI